MVRRTSANYSSWGCDGRHTHGGCVGDRNGFSHVSTNNGWICAPCTFDMCIDCARVSLYLGNIKNLIRNEKLEVYGRKELYMGFAPIKEDELAAFGDSDGGKLGNGE
jgi:hypothetical protein